MPKEPPTTAKRWKSNHQSISWSAAGDSSLKATIAGVTDSGNAILFSRTMDGSALIVQVFAGSERSKEYATSVGDIVPLLEWVLSTFS